jgi:hypothetical protein
MGYSASQESTVSSTTFTVMSLPSERLSPSYSSSVNSSVENVSVSHSPLGDLYSTERVWSFLLMPTSLPKMRSKRASLRVGFKSR